MFGARRTGEHGEIRAAQRRKVGLGAVDGGRATPHRAWQRLCAAKGRAEQAGREGRRPLIVGEEPRLDVPEPGEAPLFELTEPRLEQFGVAPGRAVVLVDRIARQQVGRGDLADSGRGGVHRGHRNAGRRRFGADDKRPSPARESADHAVDLVDLLARRPIRGRRLSVQDESRRESRPPVVRTADLQSSVGEDRREGGEGRLVGAGGSATPVLYVGARADEEDVHRLRHRAQTRQQFGHGAPQPIATCLASLPEGAERAHADPPRVPPQFVWSRGPDFGAVECAPRQLEQIVEECGLAAHRRVIRMSLRMRWL